MSTPQEVLEDLHTSLSRELLRRVQEGEEMVTKSGDVVRIGTTAATLNVARQFLKDNKIEGLAVRDTPLADLISALPVGYDADEDGDVVIPLTRLGQA